MRTDFNSFIQNKNTLMLITSLIFMCGILSFFNAIELGAAIVISLFAILLLLFNFISPKLILVWIIVFYTGFFNAYLRIAETDKLAAIAPIDAKITGQIVSIPADAASGGKKFFFKVSDVNGQKYNNKTFVTITPDNSEFPDFKAGDTFIIAGKLRIPFGATNPSQFAYQKYLRNFKTYTTLYAKASDCKEMPVQLSFKWKFLQGLNNLRDKILDVHAKYLKSPNLEILGGIVFGDDAVSPPEDIKNSFINSGILHILAASGMNVAFIYGFWCFFMRRVRLPFKFSVISGMGVIILYTLMTGLGPSVIRAALMLLFILIGKLIDRDAHSVALLALVGMLMLIYNPAYINDVGFQLSFLATFGILVTGNALLDKIKDSKIPPVITGAVLIPVVAQCWVAPVQMFYFNTFSLYSILANIAIMPFLSVVSFGGFISSVLAIFTPFSEFLCFVIDAVVNIALNVLVWISHFVSQLPNSLITTSHPNILQLIIYYAILLGITLMFKKGWNKKIFLILTTALLLLIISSVNLPNHKLQIIAFDVQNADSFLIKTPQNKYFFIDTGKFAYTSKNSQAKIIMIKYLIDRGIKNIEGLIVTHFDNDHAGGAADIMKNLNVKKVYVNTKRAKTSTAVNLFKAAQEKNIPEKIPLNGEIIYKEPDLTITTYNSCIIDNDNENSIITLLKYKNFEMLFMGDAGILAFDKIKNNLPSNIDVFKVGHHGARGVVNQEMMNKLQSKVSIVSTGTNPFGHPAKSTLDNLRNSDIYRTDRNHSIEILSDGDNFNVLTFSTDKKKYIPIKTYNTD